jgi:hypothetical protein
MIDTIANPLQAGTASIDISPPVGTLMQGYGVRRATAIADQTLASALAAGNGRTAWLLLSVDAIGLDRSFTQRVRRTIGRRLHMNPSEITINCSHTHSGPATLSHLGQVRADNIYLGLLEKRLVEVAEKAAAHRQPVRWSFGTTSLAENVNRRLRVNGRIELGVDATSPVDHRMRVIRIDAANGSHTGVPLALVVHYACHSTTSGDSLEVSADWPGAMRSRLQDFYLRGDDRPTSHFLQGCTGNLTHRIGRDQEAWPEHFGQHTTVQSRILGGLAATAAIAASEQSVEFNPVEVQVGVRQVALPFQNRWRSEKTEIQVVRLGPLHSTKYSPERAVWVVGLPGEPFTEYSTDFGSEFHKRFGAAHDRTLVCGYTNDCVGYLCTPEALREGGYEAAKAHEVYHRPAPFADNAKSILLGSSLSVAEEFAQA